MTGETLIGIVLLINGTFVLIGGIILIHQHFKQTGGDDGEEG